MRGETKVIVRAEIDYVLAIEIGQRQLLAIEHALPRMQSLGFNLRKLLAQIGKLRTIVCGHRRTSLGLRVRRAHAKW